MDKFNFKTLYFDVQSNTTTSSDLEPVISIDHVTKITDNINTLSKVLGITEMIPMPAGTTVKRYKTTVTKGGKQAAEGDLVPLTKVERKPLDPIVLELLPYRRLTTAQAIQKVGIDIALNKSDDALVTEVQKDVRNSFFSTITGTGSTAAAGGSTLQEAAAQAWGSLSVYFEDKNVTPVYFLNPLDVATYLGSAAITLQSTFGLSYLENFLGLGNAIVSPQITKGTVYATATENLNGVYVPSGGDVGNAFALTSDESGMIGITHSRADDRASINTLLMSGVCFYAEDMAGVIKSTISTTPVTPPATGGAG